MELLRAYTQGCVAMKTLALVLAAIAVAFCNRAGYCLLSDGTFATALKGAVSFDGGQRQGLSRPSEAYWIWSIWSGDSRPEMPFGLKATLWSTYTACAAWASGSTGSEGRKPTALSSDCSSCASAL